MGRHSDYPAGVYGNTVEATCCYCGYWVFMTYHRVRTQYYNGCTNPTCKGYA